MRPQHVSSRPSRRPGLAAAFGLSCAALALAGPVTAAMAQMAPYPAPMRDPAPQPSPPPQTGPRTLDIILIDVPGGEFLMGNPLGAADEPTYWTRVGPFRIMRNEVSNREFGAFIETTGRVTDSERAGGGYVFIDGNWVFVQGASWRTPHGPGSTVERLADHPVVQVSQSDAEAYCRWAGLRLPREQEWEFAARGTDGRKYPWGNEPPLLAGQPIRANIGQPACCAPSTADGYLYTWPTGVFSAGASPFGALDMAGNVWEWTATPFEGQTGRVVMRGGGWASDPDGVRVTIRHANPTDIGLDMVGFRCTGDAPNQGGRTLFRPTAPPAQQQRR